ncbi:MAG TPA: thioredoxin family protein [Pirellulales bacterium]|jgi:uncharacterized protein YyaL (SSP411 family)|nr:thioredoxin family protein [Pirellulales bacterium]
MNVKARVGWLLILSIFPTVTIGSAPATTVVWRSDVSEAWQATCAQDRPLLVFVTRDRCFYCTQMKAHTFADSGVANAVGAGFVPLLLDGGQNSPLIKDLSINVYPTTVVISPRAVVLARFEGYVAPEVLQGRLQSLRPAATAWRTSKK